LDTGVLERHGAGWRLRRDRRAPVPEALERLIRARADRLSLQAREVIVAASVLGPEIERPALEVVSELDAELDDAIAEVISAGLLVEVTGQPEPRYRFRHALIREATYNGLLRSQRRQLHARAAWDLETRCAGRLDELAAVLGGHLAVAGQGERAAHFLELAGDRAARIFANEEAIGLYRQVLAVIDGGDKKLGSAQRLLAPPEFSTGVDVCEKLAALLQLIDRFDEARIVALDGIARVPADDALSGALLRGLLSNIEAQDLRPGAASDALEVAEELLGPCAPDDDQERVDIWLELQIRKVNVALSFNELERAASILEGMRPLAETRGSPPVMAGFLMYLSIRNILARHYRVDAELVEEHRRAAKAAQAVEGTTWHLGSNPETRRFSTMMFLGEALTWYGDLDEAGAALNQVLAQVERAGTSNGRSMALTALAVTAWRQGDVALVRELLHQARAAAASGPRKGHNWTYVAAATAALEAWVAWRDQRTEEVISLGAEALELWKTQLPSFQLRFLALFPLASAYLVLGQTEKAVDAVRQTFEPTMARLPDELETALREACDAWDGGEPEKASRLVGGSLTLARGLRYA
jgi:tetratricopeptide (TPR) repeat protein